MKLITVLLSGLLLVLSGCASMQPGDVAPNEDTESSLFQPATFESYGSFVVSAGTDSKPVNMRLWYSAPDQITPDTPVVMVMHGARRDADRYRDYWGSYAKKYNALIVAPEISDKDFPPGWGFQAGNWVTPDSRSTDETKGQRVPVEHTSFATVDRAFDQLKERLNLNADTYDIWGHGGGAQFVSRMVMLYPQARIGTAIAANAGSYTFPDWTLPLRYGLKNSGIEPEDLSKAYMHRLVIMLGTEDDDPSHRLLSQLDIARAQGEHRVAKGKNFYQANKALAEQLDTEYNWELQTVYGVAHNGREMTKAGAAYLLEGRSERPLFPRDAEISEPDRRDRQSDDTNELLRGSDDGEASPF